MKAISSEVRFSEMENDILSFWEENQTFKKSNLNKTKSYTFYDGPPFANGLPHYGHLLANTIKDTVPRYWSMRGYKVDRRFGWDCHGFPVESEIEKNNSLKGRRDILKFGVAKFNEQCRESVQNYAGDWQKTITRLGRWVDWDNQYRTMDKDFMESVWWVFSKLYGKDMVYRGHKVVAYSPRNATVVSNFEANQNYKDVQDPAVTVKFKLADEQAYLLAWTTTPWTLIANLALAISPKENYVKIKLKDDGATYYLAEARLPHVFKTAKKQQPAYEVLEVVPASQLAGRYYEPIFPYFRAHPNAFRVLTDDFVTVMDGTGVVHQAPAYGEEDFRVCQQNNIDIVDPLDLDACYLDTIPEYAGQFVKDADKNIIRDLKAQNKLLKHETIVHSYPFCDRTDTPLIYRAIPAWYVRVESIKEKLVQNNQTIRWTPQHLKNGRMGKWLENAKDWAISRNRFWGTPLPIWVCDKDKDHLHVFGCVDELEKKTGQELADIHKHKIDDASFRCGDCDGTMRRVSEVFDCWFESGSMPYAQLHYPFENKGVFEDSFPADFIAEGLDQTRGWFYTLAVLSAALFDKPAFKNVVVNGIICDETGRKMSKRHKNYTPPVELIETYGADSVRLYMLNSPVLKGENLIFTTDGVRDTTRAVLLPLWNAHSFLTTYAQADSWRPTAELVQSDKPIFVGEPQALDRWIVSRLQTLTAKVHMLMEDYQLSMVIPEFLSFIDDLTNWYIRLNRRRFWSPADEEMSQSTANAYATLYWTLLHFSKIFAPFAPFVCERIYKNLVDGVAGAATSVHLNMIPQCRKESVDWDLEREIRHFQVITTLGRSIRAKQQIKTRQPLSKMKVLSPDLHLEKSLAAYQELICQELNIKEIEYGTDDLSYVQYTLKPNLKILGRKLGSKLGDLKKQLDKINADPKEVKQVVLNIEKNGKAMFGDEIELTAEEILIDRQPLGGGAVASQGETTVVLETQLDARLVKEGLAREVVNRVQNFRKDSGLDVSDRIQLALDVSSPIKDAVEEFSAYVRSETLASDFLIGEISDKMAHSGEFIVDGVDVKIGVSIVAK